MAIQKIFHHILIIGSIIGLWASFALAIDTVELIKNPAADLPCNINPFISCASTIGTWQSEVFGFPNPFLGIAAFSMLFAIGVMLFSSSPTLQSFEGASRSKKPLWLLVNLGTLAAMVFVVWFFFESVYRIGSLCLYCMITWAVTWPLFLYTTVWNFRESHFEITHPIPLLRQERVNKFFHFVSRNHIQILVSWYLIQIFLILFQFRDFFFA